MKKSFRQPMTWLHVWIGLLLGWVCYAIFVTGTLSYYRPEITRWMRPELGGSAVGADAARVALAALEERAPDAPRWSLSLPDERTREMRAFWQPAGGGRFKIEQIDPVSGGAVNARASLGGEIFYRFHFQLMLPNPWGRYMAGVAAMVMFVALITGIIAHRRFFADLFLFRVGRVALRSWLDFHNVTGVLTLPFFLMITYSGLVIFNAMYLPWPGKVLPVEKPAAAARGAPAAGESPWIEPAPVEPMLAEVQRHWGAAWPNARIDLENRGTAGATVTFTRGDPSSVSLRGRDEIVFNGATGELIRAGAIGANDGAGRTVHGVFYGLHIARFASPALRGLLFLLGLLGTALIASGLIIWTVRRRPKFAAAGAGGRFGFWLVERLNIAAIAGMPLAIAGLFWANRVLPVSFADRADWEVRCLLIVWAAALLHAAVRPALRAWREQLLVGGALFVSLPVLDATTAGEHLRAAGRALDGAYLGFEAVAVIVGVSLALAAGKVGRRAAAPMAIAPTPEPGLPAQEVRS